MRCPCAVACRRRVSDVVSSLQGKKKKNFNGLRRLHLSLLLPCSRVDRLFSAVKLYPFLFHILNVVDLAAIVPFYLEVTAAGSRGQLTFLHTIAGGIAPLCSLSSPPLPHHTASFADDGKLWLSVVLVRLVACGIGRVVVDVLRDGVR